METPGSAEIRIVRRKKGHGGHHGGAWKVAFADFMTAMMAFFLVMWICGLNTTIKSAVAAYFQDPVAFKEAVAKGNAPFAIAESTVGGPLSGTGDSTPAIPQININPNSGTDAKQLDQVRAKIEKMIADTPEFRDLKDFVDIQLTAEGLQIELLEVKQSLFFDSGSSLVKPKTKMLLMKVGKELSKVRNKMVVEGHTDSLPLRKANNYTNWELSADRANGARRILESAGLKHGQIVQVRGLADNKLRDPQNPKSYTNRRVSIIILYNRTTKPPQITEKDLSKHPDITKARPEIKSEKIPDTPAEPVQLDEPDRESAYRQPPLHTGDGDHEITVVTRDGKVYTVPAGDITEGMIPKIKPQKR